MNSTAIAIIVSVVVAIFMVISFFVGRRRGVKRTLLNGGFSLVGLILAFFLTPVITSAFMGLSANINGENVVLGTYLSSYLAKDASFGVYFTNSNSLSIFVDAIIPAICSVIIFLLLCLIFKGIFYAVYKIVEKFALKSRKEEEECGQVRNKLGGGLISVVKTFFFFLVICLPFTSLTQLVENSFFPNYAEGSASASSITDALDSLPSTAEISNEIPSNAKKIIAGFNRSVIGFTGNLFGIGDVCFDYLSQINIDGDKIYLRQTVNDFLKTYDYIIDLYEDYKKEPQNFFAELNYEELDKYKKQVFESGMFKGLVLNIVYDYTQTYEEVLKDTKFIEEYGDVLSAIKLSLSESEDPTKDLLDDIYNILDIAKSAGKTGFLDDVNALGENASLEDILYLGFDKYSDTFLSDAVECVFSVDLVRDAFAPLMDKVKEQLGSSDAEIAIKTANTNITNWDKLVFDLKDIVTDIGDLYGHIEDSLVGVKVDNVQVEFRDFMEDKYLLLKADNSKVEPVFTDIGRILDKVDNLEIMKNADSQKILNDVLKGLGVGDLLKGIVAPNGTQVNYVYLMTQLTPAVKNLLEYDLYDEIKAGDFKEAICVIGDGVYADSLLTHDAGEKTKQEKFEDVFKTIYSLPRVKELTIDEFEDSLVSFVDIAILADGEVRDAELRNLSNLLLELSRNKITVGENEQTFLRFILTDGNDFEGLIDEISEENVNALLSPILNSTMTDTICETLFSSIAKTMSDVTGNNVTVEYTRAKLQEQNDEICNIFKEILKVRDIENVSSVSDIGYTTAGTLLDTMKVNAYRNAIDATKSEGIFKVAFDSVITKAESDYNVDFKKAMNKENIYEVEFAPLFTLVEMIDNETTGFGSALKTLLKEDATTSNIETLLDSINVTNEDDVVEILAKAEEIGVTVDVTDVKLNVGGQDKDVADAIDLYEFNSTITPETLVTIKTSLKNLLV